MHFYVITGLLLFLAEPPFGFWPLAFVALIPLLHAAHRSSKLPARGDSADLFPESAFFAPGLFWLTSTTVIGWAALALYCAVYVSVFAILARFTSNVLSSCRGLDASRIRSRRYRIHRFPVASPLALAVCVYDLSRRSST